MFEFQLNEEQVNNPAIDLTRRVKELRHLGNSANEICKKIATEFSKDYDDVKRHLLPLDLKKFVGLSAEQLGKTGEKPIKDLKRKYSKYQINSNDRAVFLKRLMDAYIEG